MDKSIPELSVAKAHLASTLSGGVYSQPPEADEGDYESAYAETSASESFLSTGCIFSIGP